MRYEGTSKSCVLHASTSRTQTIDKMSSGLFIGLNNRSMFDEANVPGHINLTVVCSGAILSQFSGLVRKFPGITFGISCGSLDELRQTSSKWYGGVPLFCLLALIHWSLLYFIASCGKQQKEHSI